MHFKHSSNGSIPKKRQRRKAFFPQTPIDNLNLKFIVPLKESYVQPPVCQKTRDKMVRSVDYIHFLIFNNFGLRRPTLDQLEATEALRGIYLFSNASDFANCMFLEQALICARFERHPVFLALQKQEHNPPSKRHSLLPPQFDQKMALFIPDSHFRHMVRFGRLWVFQVHLFQLRSVFHHSAQHELVLLEFCRRFLVITGYV